MFARRMCAIWVKRHASFLFGSKSDFDSLCFDIVSEIKEKHFQCLDEIFLCNVD